MDNKLEKVSSNEKNQKGKTISYYQEWVSKIEGIENSNSDKEQFYLSIENAICSFSHFLVSKNQEFSYNLNYLPSFYDDFIKTTKALIERKNLLIDVVKYFNIKIPKTIKFCKLRISIDNVAIYSQEKKIKYYYDEDIIGKLSLGKIINIKYQWQFENNDVNNSQNYFKCYSANISNKKKTNFCLKEMGIIKVIDYIQLLNEVAGKNNHGGKAK